MIIWYSAHWLIFEFESIFFRYTRVGDLCSVTIATLTRRNPQFNQPGISQTYIDYSYIYMMYANAWDIRTDIFYWRLYKVSQVPIILLGSCKLNPS
jgi:hypothetical protein